MKLEKVNTSKKFKVCYRVSFNLNAAIVTLIPADKILISICYVQNQNKTIE